MQRVARIVGLMLVVVVAVPAMLAAQPRFQSPVLLTSAGQSADIAIAGVLFKKAGLQVTTNALAKPADLAGVKTLAVVAGFSTKGLGSAGVNRDQEMERVKGLLAAAGQQGVKVIVLHLGGKARRGAQSDEFNKLAGSAAQQFIVVRAGDEDQFFTKLAAERKVPLELVDRIADAGQPLGRLFQ